MAALGAAGPLSPRQAAVAADILLWYEEFWAQHRALCSSPARVRLLLGCLREYATGRRAAVFRPYYETLRIEPALFDQWRRELDHDGFLLAAAESSSWRGPIASIRAFEDLSLNVDRTDTGPGLADYHQCGSASYFLLGDAGFERFDLSSCWICPGTGEQVCGELCVDVRD